MRIQNDKELGFIEASRLMNIKSFKNQVRLYSIVGSNEKFIKIANKYETLDEFIKKECFDKKGTIYNDVTDYFNKFSNLDRLIITSLGIGNTKPTAISNNINIKEKLVRESLQSLKKKFYIRKELPVMKDFINVLADEIYFLSNNTLNFYFNFIYPYLNKGLIFNRDSALRHYEAVFDYQYQGKIFEGICKNLFISSIKSNQLCWNVSTFGSYWNEDNSIEIDIVSKDINRNMLFLGECKFFKSKPIDMRIYHHLKEKAKLINEKNIIYGLFSVTGFSPEIIALSKSCQHLILFNKYEKLVFN
jgi:hypothetical protein